MVGYVHAADGIDAHALGTVDAAVVGVNVGHGNSLQRGGFTFGGGQGLLPRRAVVVLYFFTVTHNVAGVGRYIFHVDALSACAFRPVVAVDDDKVCHGYIEGVCVPAIYKAHRLCGEFAFGTCCPRVNVWFYGVVPSSQVVGNLHFNHNVSGFRVGVWFRIGVGVAAFAVGGVGQCKRTIAVYGERKVNFDITGNTQFFFNTFVRTFQCCRCTFGRFYVCFAHVPIVVVAGFDKYVRFRGKCCCEFAIDKFVFAKVGGVCLASVIGTIDVAYEVVIGGATTTFATFTTFAAGGTYFCNGDGFIAGSRIQREYGRIAFGGRT